jgi:hypothetical protein
MSLSQSARFHSNGLDSENDEEDAEEMWKDLDAVERAIGVRVSHQDNDKSNSDGSEDRRPQSYEEDYNQQSDEYSNGECPAPPLEEDDEEYLNEEHHVLEGQANANAMRFSDSGMHLRRVSQESRRRYSNIVIFIV